MILSDPLKHAFATELSARLLAIPGIISVTFTGSFVDREGMGSISDIDVVVIADTLSQPVFSQCREAALGVSPALLKLPQHRIRINDTFGPLKFDESGLIVIHLMIYDVKGHRDHVLKSPFTCLDWERSPYHTGRSLRNIYPVLALQPRHFTDARRSLVNYMSDLAAGTLSYRRYEFTEQGYSEKTEHFPLDQRHQGEYAYHIVRNLLCNYAKFWHQNNELLSDSALVIFWKKHLPACSAYVDWFLAISIIKRARHEAFPPGTIANAEGFLTAFAEDLRATWGERAVRHRFVRHARTGLNDGSFLGQRRDPDVAQQPDPIPVADAPATVLCSPALRCRSTAIALAPHALPNVDARLAEIDYGLAEGLHFAQLSQQYPDLVAGWARGEDPCFPEGENTASVVARLGAFLTDLTAETTPALVVTHNVVLRVLIGSIARLPVTSWHYIPVEHLEVISVLCVDGRLYLDLTPAQTARITDAVAPHLHEIIAAS